MSNLSQCLNAFVTQLLNGGVKHVVINPGSRNFPLIKTLVDANKFVQLHSCVDERSAGFMALGLAQSTNSPVGLCCTSGTAGLNYYPAIAEALYSETPLIVLTADRPPESIDNWEGQCIRQENVFAQHVHASFQTPSSFENSDTFRSIGDSSVSQALRHKGPVHVNMPFNETFYSDWVSKDFSVEPTFAPQTSYDAIPDELANDIQKSKKILWVNGADNTLEQDKYPNQLVVFSDVISNKTEGITYWESILLTEEIEREDVLPDLLITTGKYVVSKRLRTFLRKANALTHWHLSEDREIPTPFHTAPRIVNCEVKHVLDQIEHLYTSTEYKMKFVALNNQVNKATQALNWESYSEFSVFQKVYQTLPDNAILHMSNSMPVRYVGLLSKRETIQHAANRGTSGIDGCTSTAVGYAKATDKPVFLFTGDLAFLYDVNALWQQEIPKNLKIVVFNNHGGGIFELIEGPNKYGDTLPFQTTDHGLTMEHISLHFSIDYLHATSMIEVEKCLDVFLSATKPVILEVQTQRSENNAFFESYKKALQIVSHDDK